MPYLPTAYRPQSSQKETAVTLCFHVAQYVSFWILQNLLVFSSSNHTCQLRICPLKILFSTNDSSTKGIMLAWLTSAHLPHWHQWSSMDTADVQSSYWIWNNLWIQKKIYSLMTPQTSELWGPVEARDESYLHTLIFSASSFCSSVLLQRLSSWATSFSLLIYIGA